MGFAEEFQQLLVSQPRYNVKQVNAQNCQFSDTAVKSKNCYYSFCVFYCEDTHYSQYSRECSHCVGVTFCSGCEWCLESIDCINCYNCDFCRYCHNSTNLKFCQDCYSCEKCFGCVNLYRKKFCIFNEHFTEKEYNERMKQLDLKNRDHHEAVKRKIKELRKKSFNLGVHQFNTENSIGDTLSNSGNCFWCFDGFNLEDCMYNIEANGNKDSCDISVCFESELCYDCVQAPLNYNCNFLMHTDYCSDSEFCAYSKSLKNCFGCVYLHQKNFHILNKPVSPKEYKTQIFNIKKELKEKGLYNLGLYFITDYEDKRLKELELSEITCNPAVFL